MFGILEQAATTSVDNVTFTTNSLVVNRLFLRRSQNVPPSLAIVSRVLDPINVYFHTNIHQGFHEKKN